MPEAFRLHTDQDVQSGRLWGTGRRNVKKLILCGIVLAICASVNANEIWFDLRASNNAPTNGSTETFTLSYDGTKLTAHPGWGLIFVNYNSALSGTGTWGTPTSPSILVPALAVGTPLSPTDPADPGTPFANGVTSTKLSVDMSATSFPQLIGSTGPVDVWSVQVVVHGTPGQNVQMILTSMLDVNMGAAEAWGSNANSAFSSSAVQMASKTVTIAAIPEPVSLSLIGLGVGGIAFIRRRFSR
jgi:hypothetical protein